MDVTEISRRLRAGRLVLDADFDTWLPSSVRHVSARHWTQVGVAVRVSRWLQASGVSTVLDVGSGAGKFCAVGALSSGISFTGLERRPHLVDVAHRLALRFGVAERARFVHGDLDAVDFRSFDALYFYNPFGENVMPLVDRLDDSVELGYRRFDRDVTKVQELLGQMPVGARLVTYNGYGGRVPDSFDLVQAKPAGVNMLRLWRKAREHDTGGHWAELEESTPLRSASDLERSRASAQRSGIRRVH
jgi:SAM-dependent methyltransferase